MLLFLDSSKRLPHSNCLCQPMCLCQLMNCHCQLLLNWASVEAFIRWCLIRWGFIRWSFIRWCTHPLMDVIRWSFRDIRWSFVSYPLKVFNIRWHFFTYTKLQGMKYLQLALLFAYPLVVNMTNTFLQHLRITTWIQKMKCATILNLLLSKATPSTDSQDGLIRWGYKH